MHVEPIQIAQIHLEVIHVFVKLVILVMPTSLLDVMMKMNV